MPEQDYITVSEGLFMGVSYRIRDAKFVEENGKNLVKLDYDVRNLLEKDTLKFEKFLGDIVTKALQDAIREDEENNTE